MLQVLQHTVFCIPIFKTLFTAHCNVSLWQHSSPVLMQIIFQEEKKDNLGPI